MKKALAFLMAAGMTLALGASAFAEEDPTRIALLLPYIGDQSYFDVTARGLDLVNEEYGDAVQTQLIEMGTDAAGWEAANRQAAAEGYDIIISGNFQYENAMLTVAADYPDIKFLNFDYSDPEANKKDNVYAVTYASNEVGYLAGIVAGVKSQSGIVGAIGGMDNDGIRQFLAGFMQGAHDANPDIKCITGFVGNFQDTGVAKELATNMINEGADVLYHAAGGAGNGMFEAVAAADGVWAIGVDTDQYESLSEQPDLAKTILTSSVKNCDVAIKNSIEKMLDGTAPYGQQEILTYADGGVGLAENDYYKENMTEEELAKVNELADKVKSGETKVVDQLTDATAYDTYLEMTAK